MITTITTTGAEDTRIAVAFGAHLGLAGNANAAQVKAAVVEFIKGVVREQERLAAVRATIVTDIAPT